MRDLMTVRYLYPDFRERLLRAIENFERAKSFRVRVTHGLRAMSFQAHLYAMGRTAPGKIVTNAKPGQSRHNYGVAGDICMTATGDPYLERCPRGKSLWDEWGECVEAEGLVWGGRWTRPVDKPHAEISYGLKTEDLLALYNDGGIAGVWSEFDKRRGVEVGTEWKNFISEISSQGYGKPAVPFK